MFHLLLFSSSFLMSYGGTLVFMDKIIGKIHSIGYFFFNRHVRHAIYWGCRGKINGRIKLNSGFLAGLRLTTGNLNGKVHLLHVPVIKFMWKRQLV